VACLSASALLNDHFKRSFLVSTLRCNYIGREKLQLQLLKKKDKKFHLHDKIIFDDCVSIGLQE
jgi:hypothetical protein